MKSIHAHAMLLLVGFATVLSSAALYGYMYHSVGISTDHALLARDIAAAEAFDKSREQDLTKLYADTGAERERLRSYFPGEDEVVAFVESVEALGPKSGAEIKISGLSLGRARVEATGSWGSVMRVLKLSETVGYDVSVTDVRLNAFGAAGKISSWSLSYEMAVTTN